MAKSTIDYVFRYIGMKYLSPEDKLEIFGPDHVELNESGQQPQATLASSHNHSQQKVMNADAPVCANCGTLMIKAGSCYSCPNCFATTGVCN